MLEIKFFSQNYVRAVLFFIVKFMSRLKDRLL